jgi:5'-nucleotidase
MEKDVILVVNDDGINADGLHALVAALATLGQVMVVAPNTPQSGQGHAITIEDPIRLFKEEVPGAERAYSCSGTPVDCVKLAKFHVCKGHRIVLCCSGINHGSNAGINVIYSGTMSAAMEASLEGIPSIGFSLVGHGDHDFSPTIPYVVELAKKMMSKTRPKGMNLINVNFPSTAPYKGLKLCHQGGGRWSERFKVALDPQGREYFWLAGQFIEQENHPEADLQALSEGYISVVPVMHDLTDYQGLKAMKEGFL